MPQAAACGRSEGSDGHMPLPKRGPHLRKRTPFRSGRGGRSPGAAGERALQAGGGGIGRQRPRAARRPAIRRADTNRTDRAPPTPDPAFRLPSLLPTPAAPPRLPPRRLAGLTHRSHYTHQPTHHTLSRPVAAAPPPAHQHPPGLARPGLPGGSRPPRYRVRAKGAPGPTTHDFFRIGVVGRAASCQPVAGRSGIGCFTCDCDRLCDLVARSITLGYR